MIPYKDPDTVSDKFLIDLPIFYLPLVTSPVFTRYEYHFVPLFNFINFCFLKYQFSGSSIQLFNYYTFNRLSYTLKKHKDSILFRTFTDIDYYSFEYIDR